MCMSETSNWYGTSTCRIAVLAIVLFIAASGSFAQALFPPAEDLVSVKAIASFSKFHPSSTGHVAVTAEIAEGWHINSDKPRDEFLIPTVLEVTAPEGIEIEQILYPEPFLERLAISEGLMSLYHGRVTFGARLRIASSTPPGSYTITATLSYQGCNNMTCIAPASVSTEVAIVVGSLVETVEMIQPEIFSKPPFIEAGRTPGDGAAAGEIDVTGIIEERGLFLTFILIFIAGLGLNLTPCIYPLIPITVSYFGGQSGGKTSRTFLLALLYVFGMSITYSTLGVIAATTGSLFGSALQNPWVLLFIAVVLLGLATSMFGLWEIRMPMFLTRRTGTAKQGYIGAIFMGLTVGILAAPCIGPFIIALLTYVGNLGKPVMGFLMFFTLAWGMGLPFLVLGTVSGSISRLPQSGNWMIWVRKVFGFILIAMALYFTRPIIGPLLSSFGYIVVALIAGTYLGWIDRPAGEGNVFRTTRRIFGTACIAAAVLLVALPAGPLRQRAVSPGIPWMPYSEEKLAEASGAGKPVMIDFTADWCVPCHELEHRTFSDPGVIELAGRFIPLRVDMTRIGEQEKLIKKKFRIQGVPIIVFLDGTGAEREDLRVAGFVEPERFRKILERMSEVRK
jgi:thiol:disulfide interchange protein DsbD